MIPLNKAPTNEAYLTGQYFVHAEMGYRGVILFPQLVNIVAEHTVADSTPKYFVLADARDTEQCASNFHECFIQGINQKIFFQIKHFKYFKNIILTFLR